MRCRCVLVIADALGRLQLGCRGQHCRIQVIGRLMSLLDPVCLVDLDCGSGGLPPPATVAVSSVAPGAAHTGRYNQRAVPALMDLAVPMYADPGDLPVL